MQRCSPCALTVSGVHAILRPMRAFSVIILLATLILPTGAFAEIQTFTAMHTYILGDDDSKDDARQWCLLEVKRKILEQAGVDIESVFEDKIARVAAAVMQVKDTKEEVGFHQGHMTLTLTITAQVDLAEVRKQLAARQLDAGVREDVAAQQERLKRLEAQFEAMMQRQQGGQSSGHALASPPSGISAAELHTLRTRAAQGDAKAQVHLGMLYANGHNVPKDDTQAAKWFQKAAAQGDATAQVSLGALYYLGEGVPKDDATARLLWERAAAQGKATAQVWLGTLYDKGNGVPQDFAKARQLWEQAATQGYASAQFQLGGLHYYGQGVPQDFAKAREWFEKAAAQGDAEAQTNLGMLYDNGQGVPQDDVRAYMWYRLAAAYLMGTNDTFAAENRDTVARRMTPTQIAEAQRLASRCQAQQFTGC